LKGYFDLRAVRFGMTYNIKYNYLKPCIKKSIGSDNCHLTGSFHLKKNDGQNKVLKLHSLKFLIYLYCNNNFHAFTSVHHLISMNYEHMNIFLKLVWYLLSHLLHGIFPFWLYLYYLWMFLQWVFFFICTCSLKGYFDLRAVRFGMTYNIKYNYLKPCIKKK
jgi:hypothetical protein